MYKQINLETFRLNCGKGCLLFDCKATLTRRNSSTTTHLINGNTSDKIFHREGNRFRNYLTEANNWIKKNRYSITYVYH